MAPTNDARPDSNTPFLYSAFSTSSLSKRPRENENPSLEQQLLPELISQILKKLVEQDEQAFGNLRASCTKLFQLSNEKEILTRMDLPKLLPRTSTLNNDGRRFLRRFVVLQIEEEAALMLGTDLFFHEGKTEEGLMLLKKGAASQKKQCIYNYAIALIIQDKSLAAYETFHSLLALEDNKTTIRACRNKFEEMIRSESLYKITGRERCPRTGDSHWDKGWMSIHGDAELNIKCHFCCMDIELFKLKLGI